MCRERRSPARRRVVRPAHAARIPRPVSPAAATLPLEAQRLGLEAHASDPGRASWRSGKIVECRASIPVSPPRLSSCSRAQPSGAGCSSAGTVCSTVARCASSENWGPKSRAFGSRRRWDPSILRRAPRWPRTLKRCLSFPPALRGQRGEDHLSKELTYLHACITAPADYLSLPLVRKTFLGRLPLARSEPQ